MVNDKAVGAGILVGSIAGIVIYGALLVFWTTVVLEITAFIAVVALLGILAWIGWTMASTPAPEPITDTAVPDVPTEAPPVEQEHAKAKPKSKSSK